MALPFFISSLLVPFIGIAVDKFGMRGKLLIFSAFLGVLTYILFIFATPIFPLILLGFTYAIFASVFWPALTLVVPKNIVGIALGFATSLQNLGLVFFPLIIAFIYTNSKSYDVTLLFFICIMTLALGLGVFVDFEDLKNNRTLHSVSLEEIPKTAMNKSNILSKSDKMEKDQLDPNGEKNEEEVRLLKIKELF
jgi:MFS family permease